MLVCEETNLYDLFQIIHQMILSTTSYLNLALNYDIDMFMLHSVYGHVLLVLYITLACKSCIFRLK